MLITDVCYENAERLPSFMYLSKALRQNAEEKEVDTADVKKKDLKKNQDIYVVK